jgi:hypothetical protein
MKTQHFLFISLRHSRSCSSENTSNGSARTFESRRQKKALAEFNSEIGKMIASKYLYLIENKNTPHDRLTTLKKHLAPSDATRQHDLIVRYKALQTPPPGRKVEEWLRSWVEVTNMCISAHVSETMGLRAQEDFLVACRTIDPEYGTSGLRALIDLEDAGTAVPSVEDYISKFTAYLKRVRLLSTGLSSMAAELDAAKPQQQQQQQKKKKDGNRDGNKVRPQWPCGLKHSLIDCWLINTKHPRWPKAYSNAIGQRKLDAALAALAADPDLRYRINSALGNWRARQENGGSIAMDDGSRPTRPTANTVRYTI